jgi:hypothetical protein
MCPTFARGVQHAEAGAQDRHHDDLRRDPHAGRRTERCLHGGGPGLQVAGGLKREHEAQAPGQLTERIGRRRLVAQREQQVVGDGVVDDV